MIHVPSSEIIVKLEKTESKLEKTKKVKMGKKNWTRKQGKLRVIHFWLFVVFAWANWFGSITLEWGGAGRVSLFVEQKQNVPRLMEKEKQMLPLVIIFSMSSFLSNYSIICLLETLVSYLVYPIICFSENYVFLSFNFYIFHWSSCCRSVYDLSLLIYIFLYHMLTWHWKLLKWQHTVLVWWKKD